MLLSAFPGYTLKTALWDHLTFSCNTHSLKGSLAGPERGAIINKISKNGSWKNFIYNSVMSLSRTLSIKFSN